MKRRISLFLVAIICLFILTGCKSIDYGTVIDKSFSPAHREYAPIIMYINKTTRIVPRWVHYSDQWSILVENEEGKEWWEVAEGYYNSVNIGDNVDRRTK